ncbi:MAG: hypothetical protein GX962_13220 [Epulopiscium sp.]|mgnify:CR=1 FL=1|nr:hypothetical protein [Candidatus Epulonipiscium sp.]
MIIRWTKWFEKKISNSRVLIYIYEKYYKNIVKREIELAAVTNQDRILCIGGGSIPCTALQMASQTGAKVHVIDVDHKAVDNAIKVIRKRGCHDNIYVTKANGEEVNVDFYDVVHVALQVTPKEDVIEHLIQGCKQGTRILIRLPKNHMKYFYSNISQKFLYRKNVYVQNCYVEKGFHTMKEVLLMTKR